VTKRFRPNYDLAPAGSGKASEIQSHEDPLNAPTYPVFLWILPVLVDRGLQVVAMVLLYLALLSSIKVSQPNPKKLSRVILRGTATEGYEVVYVLSTGLRHVCVFDKVSWVGVASGCRSRHCEGESKSRGSEAAGEKLRRRHARSYVWRYSDMRVSASSAFTFTRRAVTQSSSSHGSLPMVDGTCSHPMSFLLT